VAVRLRLTRVGSRKNPIWRVVAADGRSKRDGRVLETVGRYNPQRQPSEIVLDRERIDHWIARGAQPSDTVRKLIRAVERGAPPAAAAAADARPAGTATATAEPPAGDDTEAISSHEASGDPAASAEEGASVADAAPADEIPSAEEGEG
jgi:small subunit ribosomal protein S16